MDKGTIKKINNLIVSIGRGNKDSLEKLFSLTKRQLYVVAEVHLFDKSKTDDVLSETYCRVVRYAETFNKHKNGYNWLYQIVKNICYSLNKYDNLHMTVDIDDEYNLSTQDVALSLDNILLHDAIETLSTEEKRIIWYYYFAGYSTQEVANLIGKPKSTTNDMLHRILNKLRDILDR